MGGEVVFPAIRKRPMTASVDPPTQTPPRKSRSAVRDDGMAWAPLHRVADVTFRLLCQSAAVLIILLAAALVAVLVWQAQDSFKVNGLGFLFSSDWDPVDGEGHRKFGALAFVYGTVVTSVLAMLIAIPLGVGTATFLAEIAPHWLRRIGSFLVEMLATIPSVVYGFWGLLVFAPWFQCAVKSLGGPDQSGTSLLSAGLILGVMVVPYIAAVSFEVILRVPPRPAGGAVAVGPAPWPSV